MPSLQTVTKNASSLGACLSKVQQRQEIESSTKIAYMTFKLSDLNAEQGGCSQLRCVGMLTQPEQPMGTQQRRFQGAIHLACYNWEYAGFTGSIHGSNCPLGEKNPLPLGDENRDWARKEQGSVTQPVLASLHEDKYSYEMSP